MIRTLEKGRFLMFVFCILSYSVLISLGAKLQNRSTHPFLFVRPSNPLALFRIHMGFFAYFSNHAPIEAEIFIRKGQGYESTSKISRSRSQRTWGSSHNSRLTKLSVFISPQKMGLFIIYTRILNFCYFWTFCTLHFLNSMWFFGPWIQIATWRRVNH